VHSFQTLPARVQICLAQHLWAPDTCKESHCHIMARRRRRATQGVGGFMRSVFGRCFSRPATVEVLFQASGILW
jgi:hypothetical protein